MEHCGLAGTGYCTSCGGIDDDPGWMDCDVCGWRTYAVERCRVDEATGKVTCPDCLRAEREEGDDGKAV